MYKYMEINDCLSSESCLLQHISQQEIFLYKYICVYIYNGVNSLRNI